MSPRHLICGWGWSWIWLHLIQRATVTVRDSLASKLAPKFFGPYEVTARIVPVVYRPRLLAKAKIHDVFHVVFLKGYVGTSP
jgi:hypothetical protein